MKKEKFNKALGAQIRRIRMNKGISLLGLAKKTSKAPRSILRLEKGETSVSLHYINEIAGGLGISLEELVKGL